MPQDLTARNLKVPDMTEFGVKKSSAKEGKGSVSWWKKLGFAN